MYDYNPIYDLHLFSSFFTNDIDKFLISSEEKIKVKNLLQSLVPQNSLNSNYINAHV